MTKFKLLSILVPSVVGTTIVVPPVAIALSTNFTINFNVEGGGTIDVGPIKLKEPTKWADLKDQIKYTADEYWVFDKFLLNGQDLEDESLISQTCTITAKFRHDMSKIQQIWFELGTGQEGGTVEPRGYQTYWKGYTFGDIRLGRTTEETTFPQAIPESDNYVFANWCSDTSCTNPIDDSTPIDSFTGAYAKFTMNPAKFSHVTYKVEGGHARGEIIEGGDLYVPVGTIWGQMDRPVVRCNDGWAEAGWYINDQPIDENKVFDKDETITIKFQYALTQDHFVFKKNNDDTYTITGYLTKEEEEPIEAIVFPSWYMYNQVLYKVTQIGNGTALFTNEMAQGIKSITIPNTIKTISSKAFNGCNNLESISYPDSLETIKDGILDTNSKIKSINIPRHVKSIVSGSTTSYTSQFGGWSALEKITVSKYNEIYTDANQNCIVDIQNHALIAGCKTTVIPNDVTTIEKCAFYKTNISSINIPVNVEQINEYAFGDSSLSALTFSMGDGNDLIIGDRVFTRCPISNVAIPDRTTSIGTCAFLGTNIESFVVTTNVSHLGDGFLGSCKNLTSLTLDNSKYFTTGTGGANCIVQHYEPVVGDPYDRIICGIKTITWPTDVDYIWNNAFNYATFEDIVIPNTIKTIGSGAFMYCEDATSITIPSSATTIKSSAFRFCKKVTKLDLQDFGETDPETLTDWTRNIFQFADSGTIILKTSAQSHDEAWTTKLASCGITFKEEGQETGWTIDYQ